MRLYLDDLRPMPKECTHLAYSVNHAKYLITEAEKRNEPIEYIDMDHDLGDYSGDGGDGIKLIDWLLERGTLYPIKLHTANPVGMSNMRRILYKFWPQ